MFQFIKKNYLSEKRLIINLMNILSSTAFAIFYCCLGLNSRISLSVIILVVSLFIVRAAMSVYCIIKFTLGNNPK